MSLEVVLSRTPASGYASLYRPITLRLVPTSGGGEELTCLRGRAMFPAISASFQTARNRYPESPGVENFLLWRLYYDNMSGTDEPATRCAKCPDAHIMSFRRTTSPMGHSIDQLGVPVIGRIGEMPRAHVDTLVDQLLALTEYQVALQGVETPTEDMKAKISTNREMFPENSAINDPFPVVVYGAVTGQRLFSPIFNCNSHFHSSKRFIISIQRVAIDRATREVVSTSTARLGPIHVVSKFIERINEVSLPPLPAFAQVSGTPGAGRVRVAGLKHSASAPSVLRRGGGAVKAEGQGRTGKRRRHDMEDDEGFGAEQYAGAGDLSHGMVAMPQPPAQRPRHHGEYAGAAPGLYGYDQRYAARGQMSGQPSPMSSPASAPSILSITPEPSLQQQMSHGAGGSHGHLPQRSVSQPGVAPQMQQMAYSDSHYESAAAQPPYSMSRAGHSLPPPLPPPMFARGHALTSHGQQLTSPDSLAHTLRQVMGDEDEEEEEPEESHYMHESSMSGHSRYSDNYLRAAVPQHRILPRPENAAPPPAPHHHMRHAPQQQPPPPMSMSYGAPQPATRSPQATVQDFAPQLLMQHQHHQPQYPLAMPPASPNLLSGSGLLSGHLPIQTHSPMMSGGIGINPFGTPPQHVTSTGVGPTAYTRATGLTGGMDPLGSLHTSPAPTTPSPALNELQGTWDLPFTPAATAATTPSERYSFFQFAAGGAGLLPNEAIGAAPMAGGDPNNLPGGVLGSLAFSHPDTGPGSIVPGQLPPSRASAEELDLLGRYFPQLSSHDRHGSFPGDPH